MNIKDKKEIRKLQDNIGEWETTQRKIRELGDYDTKIINRIDKEIEIISDKITILYQKNNIY